MKNKGTAGVVAPEKVLSAAKGDTNPAGMVLKETVLLLGGMRRPSLLQRPSASLSGKEMAPKVPVGLLCAILMCLSQPLKRPTAGNSLIVSHRAAAWFLLLSVKDVEQTNKENDMHVGFARLIQNLDGHHTDHEVYQHVLGMAELAEPRGECGRRTPRLDNHVSPLLGRSVWILMMSS